MCSVELSPMNNKNGHGRRRDKKNRNHSRKKAHNKWIYFREECSNQQQSTSLNAIHWRNFNMVSHQVLTRLKHGKNISHFLSLSLSRFLCVVKKRENYTIFEWHSRCTLVLCWWHFCDHKPLIAASSRKTTKQNESHLFCRYLCSIVLCDVVFFSYVRFRLFFHRCKAFQRTKWHHHYHVRFMINVTRITCASFHLN